MYSISDTSPQSNPKGQTEKQKKIRYKKLNESVRTKERE